MFSHNVTYVFRPGGVALPDIPVVHRWPEWTLRGISQVVFQNNWLTGLIILGAIFYNSWVYGVACLVGTVTSTVTAVLLKADRNMVKAGLFGFNGALLGIGLNAFMSQNFTNGELPSWRLYLYIVLGAAFTAVVFSALLTAFRPFDIPALTAPFVIAAWLFIFAVVRFAHLPPGPLLTPGLPSPVQGAGDQYTWTTWYQGIGKGVGEIFFQDNWITGFLIVLGILVNSRISAGMALLGSVLALATAIVLGAPESMVRGGLFGFNAALTAIALGGFFYVLTVRGFLYTIFGILVTTWVWAAISVALSPIGMPAFTSAFVIVTLLMLFAKGFFPGLVPVATEDATTAEDNLARWRRHVEQAEARGPAVG
ncbi:urea transporter [Carbonactinospora thermoautotrophica]|uniref:urea transporter n=1 Tax=Carbonactinospora thermoautotrophica TaxID=1469144 RepID=UPI003DA9E6C6